MKRIAGLILLVLFTATGCGPRAVTRTADLSEPHLVITIVFNTEKYKSFMLRKFYPSYAVWAGDRATGETHTIYVTGKAARGEWMMADERPSSIPVWFGVKKKTKEEPKAPELDSVTSATPSGETVTHVWNIPRSMLNRRIDVYLEGNVSFDYNNFYRKDARKGEPGFSDVNGQPSLIWMGTIETGPRDNGSVPELLGHGHVLGENADIERDLSNITTAKEIFIHVDYRYVKGRKK